MPPNQKSKQSRVTNLYLYKHGVKLTYVRSWGTALVLPSPPQPTTGLRQWHNKESVNILPNFPTGPEYRHGIEPDCACIFRLPHSFMIWDFPARCIHSIKMVKYLKTPAKRCSHIQLIELDFTCPSLPGNFFMSFESIGKWFTMRQVFFFFLTVIETCGNPIHSWFEISC